MMKLREIDQLVATKVLNWEHHVSVYTWGERFSPEKYTTKEEKYYHMNYLIFLHIY